MDTYRGYNLKNRKGLSHWDPILEEWLLSVERYCRIQKGEDAPYWHGERTNIGILAAAAWRCGRISLEEFQVEKGYRNEKKKNGRADLWIASDYDQEEIIEAKFKWVSLNSKSLDDAVRGTMSRAIDDAKKTRANQKELKAIGIGFFSVYISKNKNKEVDEMIERMIGDFNDLEHHALAWCFPKETRNHISEKGNLLPGIFMMIHNIDY